MAPSRNALVCPFHGWVYNLDGTLRGAARPRSFPELDKVEFGLKPIELEIWMGFIFVRFRPGPQAAVADLLRRHEPEIAHYGIGDMVPAWGIWTQTSSGQLEVGPRRRQRGLPRRHGASALQDLYGATYYDEAVRGWRLAVLRDLQSACGRRWSVRNYVRITPRPERLPESLRDAWIYYGMFPNTVIAVTPETAQFYQEFPLSTGETLLRGAIYRYRDEDRRGAAARYLAYRIDRDTMAEDVQLSEWSNESMLSDAFEGFYLSDLEYGVRSHHDHLRRLLPVLRLESTPSEKDIPALNEAMGR